MMQHLLAESHETGSEGKRLYLPITTIRREWIRAEIIESMVHSMD